MSLYLCRSVEHQGKTQTCWRKLSALYSQYVNRGSWSRDQGSRIRGETWWSDRPAAHPKLSILPPAAHFCLPARIVHPHRPHSPPFFDIGQIFLPSLTQWGGPPSAGKDTTAARQLSLLLSSSSHWWCTRNTVLYMFLTFRKPNLSSRLFLLCSEREKAYFLLANFCISCWRSVFVEYPALPTLTGGSSWLWKAPPAFKYIRHFSTSSVSLLFTLHNLLRFKFTFQHLTSSALPLSTFFNIHHIY